MLVLDSFLLGLTLYYTCHFYFYSNLLDLSNAKNYHGAYIHAGFQTPYLPSDRVTDHVTLLRHTKIRHAFHSHVNHVN